MVAIILPPPPIIQPRKLYDLIVQQGMASSLAFVIDAGDPASTVNSTNQTLGTVPPGTGVAITRGPTTAVESAKDPVFVGTIGAQSAAEYWRQDTVAGVSGQRFESPAGQAVFDIHKDNSKFTFCGVLYAPPAYDGLVIFDTGGSALSSNIGATLGTTAAALSPPANNPAISATNGSAAWVINAIARTLTAPTNAIFFFGASYNETTGALIFQINGSQEAQSVSYVSPSAAAATFGPYIASQDGGAATASGRMYNAAFWSRALSSAEMLELYYQQKAKFGF